MQRKARIAQVARRCRQSGLRAKQVLRRGQESLVFAHAGDITLFLQRIFGQGLISQGRQQYMTAAAGLQSRQGGLDLLDRSDHAAPVGGGSLIQPGLGEIDVAAQPRSLEYRTQQVETQVAEPLVRVEPLPAFGALQPDGTVQGQARKHVRAPGADRVAGRFHALPRRAHVGTLRQEVGRYACGDRFERGGRRQGIGQHFIQV